MANRIPQTVGGLLINAERKVLLGLRAPTKQSWPNHWDTIGGRVEQGEANYAALIREVQEETGVTPTEFKWIAALREPRPDLYGDALHHVYAVTRWTGGEPANVSDEHSELKWFAIAEMQRLTNIVDTMYAFLAAQAIADISPTGSGHS